MSKNAINGLNGRYNATPLTLSDGDSLALQVSESGAVKLTTTLPGGTGQAATNILNGQPARYNENLITLQDGDATTIQTDVNGTTIVSFA